MYAVNGYQITQRYFAPSLFNEHLELVAGAGRVLKLQLLGWLVSSPFHPPCQAEWSGYSGTKRFSVSYLNSSDPGNPLWVHDWQLRVCLRALSVLTQIVFGGLQVDHPPGAFLLKLVFSHGLTVSESAELWDKLQRWWVFPDFNMGTSEEMVTRPSGWYAI